MGELVTTDSAFFGTSPDVSTGAADYRDRPPDEARGILGSCCLIVDTLPARSCPPKCTSKSRFEVWPRAIHCCPYATTPLCLSLPHSNQCPSLAPVPVAVLNPKVFKTKISHTHSLILPNTSNFFSLPHSSIQQFPLSHIAACRNLLSLSLTHTAASSKFLSRAQQHAVSPNQNSSALILLTRVKCVNILQLKSLQFT